MHPSIPFIIGILAVAAFLFSYQQKKRANIILFNVISRILYIIQYCLLGAFSGAVLDVLGTGSSIAAGQSERPRIRRFKWVILALVNAAIITAGLLLYENIFSLFPIVGVLLHTSAFWIKNERIIRIVSLLGSPFWFVYNLTSLAYGSAIGDILTMVSIIIAMIRYRRQALE